MSEIQPGSISSGTLRSSDLIVAFWDYLGSHGYDMFHLQHEAYDIYAAAVDDPDSVNYGDMAEDASWLINERLFDALESLGPEGFYFGGHPDDGSDFGYWIVDEEG